MEYRPGLFPTRTRENEEVVDWLEKEFNTIAQAIHNPDVLELRTLHAEPKKLRPGLIALADGTDWNPGSGTGLYIYHTGAWHFIA